jgi:hypothetical protein
VPTGDRIGSRRRQGYDVGWRHDTNVLAVDGPSTGGRRAVVVAVRTGCSTVPANRSFQGPHRLKDPAPILFRSHQLPSDLVHTGSPPIGYE